LVNDVAMNVECGGLFRLGVPFSAVRHVREAQ
jgi:hypothetical protein